MNKTQPNLDLLYDKVLEFNEIQPGEYFDSTLYYLSENTSQIHTIFDNLSAVFGNNPSLLNALKVVFLIVARLGAPAFFGLEGSRIPELHPDPITQHNELLELKRIMKYCLERFQKMQTAHEIPNIAQKYAELCQLTDEDVSIGELQLTQFEKQYSELAVKFQQFEQRLEVLISDRQENKDVKVDSENAKLLQLLEQVDSLMIQPEQGFTKSENELILNFFHQKYALINKIHNEFPQIAQEYQKMKEERKAKKQQEKGEEEQRQPQDQQIQNIKDFTYFVEGTSLAAFPESMSIEYKDYIYPFRNEELKKKMKATICAFLNTNGGRILIGVGNTGFRVKGLFLTTNDQDTLIRDIDALLKDFHPKVDPEEVTTTFVPIKKRDNTYKPGFYVVKIIVKRGKPNDLYFVGRDCYKRRNGQNDVQMPGNFKRDIIDRLGITMLNQPELFKDRGEFNDANPELGIPVTNVKEKRTPETKPAKALGVKQKQGVQVAAGTTKLLVKNVPNKPDVGLELKGVLDSIQPLSKTLHFTKDNDVVLTFMKVEDTRMFLEYVEGNPIVIGANLLQFTPKPVDKEKTEKNKVKVEVEEDKKDPVKVKAESSNIIWVRGIPENTNDLKEKLMAILGEYSALLKDIKIHNKKKRATLEFETSILANQVFNYLNAGDRFIGENKVTFEKASPPSSPNQATKPADARALEPVKTKETAKVVEQGKQKEIKKSESLKDGGKVEGEPGVVETNVLKISNVPLEETSQDIGYLVKACSHHIKKSVEKKIVKDFVLFTFKDKEDAMKAYSFLSQNNFSFKGKKMKVDYYTAPPQKTENTKPKNAKAQVPTQASNAQAGGLVANKQEVIGQDTQITGLPQNVDMSNQNRMTGPMYGNFMQPELQGQGQGMMDYQMHQQPQFNPYMMQGHGNYPQDPSFMNSQVGPQFNTPFDLGYHPGGYDAFGNMQRSQQQGGDTANELLHASEVIQPESIQFNVQNTSQTSDLQQQHPSSQASTLPQNVSVTQNQPAESQPSSATVIKEPSSQAQVQSQPQAQAQAQAQTQPQTQAQTQTQTQAPQTQAQAQGQANLNQDNTQKVQASQPTQSIQSPQTGILSSEYQNVPMMNQQQNATSNFPQYQQNQLSQNNQSNLPQLQVPNQQNFIQDQKNVNQQNAYQYPQQSMPQMGNQVPNTKPSPTNSNQIQSTGFPEQMNKPNMNQNQQVNPMYYNQFPQQQFTPQFNVQQNIPQPNSQYPMNAMQQNPHIPKTIPQNLYPPGVNPIQSNNYVGQWQQNQPQGVNQQFNTYPMQQYAQGQPYVQQGMGQQMPNIKQMGQYGMQQGQYQIPQGQFGNQTPQFAFPGTFNQGNMGQIDQTNQGNIQQTANLQATKNQSSENVPKKQIVQNTMQGQGQGQGQLQGQGQMQGQGQIPIMANQQGFGGPSYYSGFPQGQMQNNFVYGQQMGYNQNQSVPNVMYGNMQGGNMQGNLQPIIGNQGLTPQQMQQMQMQQLQYGGQSSPYVGGKNPTM